MHPDQRQCEQQASAEEPAQAGAERRGGGGALDGGEHGRQDKGGVGDVEVVLLGNGEAAEAEGEPGQGGAGHKKERRTRCVSALFVVLVAGVGLEPTTSGL